MMQLFNSKFLSSSYLVSLCIILYVGAGSSIFQTDNPQVNPIGFVIYFLCNFYLCCRLSSDEFNLLITPFSIILIWCLIHFFKDSAFQYITYTFFVLHIFTAFMIVRYYQENLLTYVEELLHMLAVVGLFFWLLNIVFGHEFLRMLSPFDSSTYNNMYKQSGSFLVYTVSAPGLQDSFGGVLRNYGFCWEPGRFASMMVIGLSLYIIRLEGYLRFRDVHLWFYIAAIISTFSTTGYVASLIILSVAYLFSSQVSAFTKILLVLSMIFIIPWLYSMDFIGAKIETKMSKENYFTNQNMDWINSTERIFTVDRFEGMALDVKNFMNDPIVGYGLAVSDTFIYKNISRNIITSNGIVKPFAQFGFILGFFLFLLYWKSTLLISSQNGNQLKFLLFLATILISISYNFFQNSLFFSFLFYSIFLNPKSSNDYE